MGEVTTKGRFAPPTIAQVAETDLVDRVDGVLTQGNYATTANVDLYVDDATGNDTTGDGSVGAPYKTITRAYADVPRDIAHVVHIHIAAGTYTAFPTLIQHNFLTSAAELIFDGTAALTNEVTEYTVDAGGPSALTLRCYDIPVVGGGLGVDALKESFIRFTSGAGNGKTGIVISNTATTLRVQTNQSGVLAGDTFKVMTHGVIVSAAQAISVLHRDCPATIGGISIAGISFAITSMLIDGGRINVPGCKFVVSATSNFGGSVSIYGNANSSNLDDATIFASNSGNASIKKTGGYLNLAGGRIYAAAFFSGVDVIDGHGYLVFCCINNAANGYGMDVYNPCKIAYVYIAAKTNDYAVRYQQANLLDITNMYVASALQAIRTWPAQSNVRISGLTGSAVDVTNALMVGQGSNVTIENASCTLVGSGGAGAAVQWSSGAAGSAYPAANNVVTDALGAQVAGY